MTNESDGQKKTVTLMIPQRSLEGLLQREGLAVTVRPNGHALQVHDPPSVETTSRLLIARATAYLEAHPHLLLDPSTFLSYARWIIRDDFVRLFLPTSTRAGSNLYEEGVNTARRHTAIGKVEEKLHKRGFYSVCGRNKNMGMEWLCAIPDQMHRNPEILGLREKENRRIQGSDDSNAMKKAYDDKTQWLQQPLAFPIPSA